MSETDTRVLPSGQVNIEGLGRARMRKTKYSNAMIKAEVWHSSDPDELSSALRESLAPKQQAIEHRLDNLAAMLAAFLKEKGCPHPIEFCR